MGTTSTHQFKQIVRQHYQSSGRHNLSWRQTNDPYHILVSELMLQQTQVARVEPKFQAFVKRWPTVSELATAKLGEVLQYWQGLGYNRRAKYLHQAANEIIDKYEGVFPSSAERLKELPGIGPYTAGAVSVFAFNQSEIIIETNIRTVYYYHFFSDGTVIDDRDIVPLLQQTLDTVNPREWYWALMDYGAHLKRQGIKLNHKQKGFRAQTPFENSDRQIRGAIIRVLTETEKSSLKQLITLVGTTKERLEVQLKSLVHEGLVAKHGQLYQLPQ